MEDRIVTPSMDQLLRRLAEAHRSIAADRELIELLEAEKARRDPLYFAACALCSWIYGEDPVIDRDPLVGARLQQALMAAFRANTPEPEEAA